VSEPQDYVITVRVPFTYKGTEESGPVAVGLAYVLDAISEHGLNGMSDDVTVKVKKRRKKVK
jgi:hypothetical protein